MRLSTRARYALRMMLEIARLSNGGTTVSLKQVATNTNLSRRYLEQLVIGLKAASLINGIIGKGGGYVLARAAHEIRIGDIVEAAIGPINIVECIRRPEGCMQVDYCECRPVYQRINDRIIEVLNDFSLADLVEQNRHEKPSIVLHNEAPDCVSCKTPGSNR